MKIAFLVVAHKNPEQINLFLKQLLMYEGSHIFINIDKKSKIRESEIVKSSRIYINNPRINVNWGEISQIDVTISLLELALSKKIDFNYYSFHSGQDLAIKPITNFVDFLKRNNGMSLLHTGHGDYKEGKLPFPNSTKGGFERFQLKWPKNSKKTKRDKFKLYLFKLVVVPLFHWGLIKGKEIPALDYYKGSNWFTFHKEAVTYILSHIKENKEYHLLFKDSFCCDEIFFHTILFNSPLKDSIIRNDFRYTDWTSGPEYPRVLRSSDFDKIIESDTFFARKFDIKIDEEIINNIYNFTFKKNSSLY